MSNRETALSEVASLAVQKTDRKKYNNADRHLMQKRIEELVARWNFTGKEVHDQIKAQSS